MKKSYYFKISLKAAMTNVQTKPCSNISSNISISVFKGFFLTRAHKTCFNKYLHEDVQFSQMFSQKMVIVKTPFLGQQKII